MSPHPFAHRWNHNSHYYPWVAQALAAADGPVMDLGCGEGTFLRWLRTQRGGLMVGADPDHGVLPRGDDGVAYVAARAEALPLATGCLAGVSAIASLHHVDVCLALAEIRRVLRPGGRLVVVGLARDATPMDWLHSLRDAVWHRAWRLRMQRWEPATVKRDAR